MNRQVTNREEELREKLTDRRVRAAGMQCGKTHTVVNRLIAKAENERKKR